MNEDGNDYMAHSQGAFLQAISTLLALKKVRLLYFWVGDRLTKL
jgi:hypothetical protein